MDTVKKTIKPFEYKDKDDFKKQRINNFRYIAYFNFLLFGFIAMFTVVIFSIMWDHTLILGLVPLTCLGIVINRIFERYDIGDFDEERHYRKNMKKSSNYQPLSLATRSLNNVIELENGKLFRKYHFINAEKSNENEIVVELPFNAKEYNLNNTIEENSCMFERLSEVDLCNILTPIQDYYIDKKKREKIYKDEKAYNEKSKLNTEITNNEIESLPVFKSMSKLKENTIKELEVYNSDLINQENKYKYIKEASL
ncbi:hypothetical protein [Mammaliicoccus sciuri]|uniref:hypothetical protein n=1 Tax=Mammaliicoccus sciuri TaxID=1296 RepID=UPI0019505D47|nr:hypothetical protein [Mammaliicoccus sciuri]